VKLNLDLVLSFVYQAQALLKSAKMKDLSFELPVKMIGSYGGIYLISQFTFSNISFMGMEIRV
jgi:hypothetical protein